MPQSSNNWLNKYFASGASSEMQLKEYILAVFWIKIAYKK